MMNDWIRRSITGLQAPLRGCTLRDGRWIDARPRKPTDRRGLTMNRKNELCSNCEHVATHTGSMCEPLCEQCWREAGMYDPSQGFEPTERDYEAFSAR